MCQLWPNANSFKDTGNRKALYSASHTLTTQATIRSLDYLENCASPDVAPSQAVFAKVLCIVEQMLYISYRPDPPVATRRAMSATQNASFARLVDIDSATICRIRSNISFLK